MSYHRERCLRKRRYRNRQHALDALAEIRARRPRKARGLRPYRCLFGNGHHHLGHVPSMETLEALALELRGLK